MEHSSPIGSLLLVTLLALFVPILTSRVQRFRLPIVVGEILAGILVGQSGLGLIEPTPVLAFLAEFGFTFLMFLSGLEVNFETLFGGAPGSERRDRWSRPVPLALLYFGSTVVLAVLVGLGLSAAGLARNPVLMGLILSTTSLGIVVPTLKERRLMPTLYGQAILAAALVSDFCTLLLLSLTIAVIGKGFSLDLLLFLLLIGAFAAAAKLGQWMTRHPLLTRIVEELSHATAQIRVRGAFALMVLWAVLAHSLGVEIILGAFLAGAILSVSSRSHDSPLRETLDAIGYGFFVPIFFILVGARFELRALLASPTALLLVPVLILAAYLVKLLPALVFRRIFSWREALAAGALLSSRLSLIIAASAIALQMELISSATNSAVVLVAIVTCTFSPLLFSRLLPPMPELRREGVVLLGTDQLAVLLGQRLLHGGESITFIGRDQATLQHLERDGFRCVLGAPEDEQVLARAGLERARALVAVSNAPELVVSVCRLARERFGVPVVVARADEPSTVAKLQAMQVHVVQPAMAAALALEAALHFPAAFAMLLDKRDGVDFVDVPLANLQLEGLALRKVRLPGNALVLGIHRQGEVVVPHGDTVLRHGDILMLVGTAESLQGAQQFLGHPA